MQIEPQPHEVVEGLGTGVWEVGILEKTLCAWNPIENGFNSDGWAGGVLASSGDEGGSFEGVDEVEGVEVVEGN